MCCRGHEAASLCQMHLAGADSAAVLKCCRRRLAIVPFRSNYCPVDCMGAGSSLAASAALPLRPSMQGVIGSCGMQGVPEERVSAEVATVLRRTALPPEMAGRPAGQYSGGSKRKLALGIALVGGSSTILLDEPSSGMVRHNLDASLLQPSSGSPACTIYDVRR